MIFLWFTADTAAAMTLQLLPLFLDISTPYILMAGRKVKWRATFTVALFAIYYVYDIAYPKQCSNSCLFIERFLFALKGPQQLTQTAIGTIASIEHLVFCSVFHFYFYL